MVASCDCAGAGAAAVERANAVAGKRGSSCPGTRGATLNGATTRVPSDKRAGKWRTSPQAPAPSAAAGSSRATWT
eukprot:4025749-Alexandrium_andersonii.AAC.1